MPVVSANGVLEALVPRGVVVAEAFELDDVPSPHPVERACVEQAVERRRHEFFTARRLGREALARAGAAPGPIGRGVAGEPCWPAGFTGSLTHCAGFIGAVTASVGVSRALGIDAEPNRPLPPGVLSAVAHGSEATLITTLLERHPQVSFDRLLFCVKEATYKVWYPLERSWLGFEDAEVEIDARGGFTSHLRSPGPHSGIRQVSGLWSAGAGLLVCAAAAPPARVPS